MEELRAPDFDLLHFDPPDFPLPVREMEMPGSAKQSGVPRLRPSVGARIHGKFRWGRRRVIARRDVSVADVFYRLK